MTHQHLKHNSPYLRVRLKRLKKGGYNVHVKKGMFWRKVGHFNNYDDAIERVEDIAELNRKRDPR